MYKIIFGFFPGSDMCVSYRVCTTGLPSDIIVRVGEMSFHLHKVHFVHEIDVQ